MYCSLEGPYEFSRDFVVVQKRHVTWCIDCAWFAMNFSSLW